MERAIKFIEALAERGIVCRLKADGSVTAHLSPGLAGEKWGEEWLAQYLRQEVRMSNFQDVVKRKGYGSIFLTDPYAEQVLHVRVVGDEWHYID